MSVRCLKSAFSLMLVLLWVPVSVHCMLEKLPGLGFLSCAAEAPKNAECEDDGCQVVESGAYKIENHQIAVEPWLPLAIALTALVPLEGSSLDPAWLLEATAAPPEICCSWRFSARTALPPRAPSFVS